MKALIVLLSFLFAPLAWAQVTAKVVGDSTATINIAVVPVSVEVTAKGTGALREFIGIYDLKAPNTLYRDWRRLDGTKTPRPVAVPSNGTVTFLLPPGKFEARLCLATDDAITCNPQIATFEVPSAAQFSLEIETLPGTKVTRAPTPNGGEHITMNNGIQTVVVSRDANVLITVK